MLFSKDIDPACGLCAHATPIDEDTVLCHKKGPMPITDCCRRYKYDPLLRKPHQQAQPRKKFTAKDFEL